MKTRKKIDFEKKTSICLYIYSMIMVVFTAFSILYNVGVIKINETTSPYRESPDLNECLDDILLLKEESFEKLDDDKKIEVLQTLVYVENSKAGIKTCPIIKLSDDLSDSVAGCYVHKKCEILIDKDVFHSSSSPELVNIVLHEWHHHFSHELADAYEALPARYKDLEAFCVYREYAYEFDHYVDVEEDLGDYYSQSLESSARRFAADQTAGYFKFINNYEPD